MTGQAKLMRQANALCKAIQKAREEIAEPSKDGPGVRFARAIVCVQSKFLHARNMPG